MLHFYLHLSRDEDLLDQVTETPTTNTDVVIEIAKIQWAAEKLRDSTAFLKDLEVLNDTIPVVRASINSLIAGPNRTIAGIFDLTGEYFFTAIV